ncbi:uncharacterized protein LOC133304589 [Gastrolobium bilobum]|uniref:uncharacterized protein LOC133304589 n=1 Tax=Gastrolobium bilobum TaxID=150636 RepID=UPI002AAFBF0A|nr:uncharacterized protein LOC133304589 [Gastrolobium bilobum]
MEESRRKVTVTSLASLFPVEEAQKAAKRVEDAIAEKRNELDTLRGFVGDNNNLVNLVQKLLDHLSHDIMVPFGKAAFFPGCLIHTNEFLVLLGEGYYAERTSKQAVEILQRRGKSLDSHVDSLEAMIKDLEAESSFFNSTASEAALERKYIRKGFVEIREDYEEEGSNEGESKSGPPEQDAFNFENAIADDGEYARIVSRLDELEKEELAAESDNQSHQNEEPTADFDGISYQRPIDDNLQNLEDFHECVPLDQTNRNIIATESPKKNNHQEDIVDQLNFASLAMESKVRDGKSSQQNVESIIPIEKLPILPKQKTVQATTASNIEVPHQTSEPSFHHSIVARLHHRAC